MWREYLIGLLLLFSLSRVNGQDEIRLSPNDSNRISKYYFGLSLMPCGEDLITYAIVVVNPDGNLEFKFLTRHTFIMQMIGFQESIANPDKVNLLQQRGINGPEVFMDIWKLRYSEYPYAGNVNEEGWANKLFTPTKDQLEMLKAFGVETINDYFYGDNLYALFNAMLDPAWVQEYRSK